MGVNKFLVDKEPEITIHRVRETVWEEKRKAYLKQFRAKRDNVRVKEALAEVSDKVKGKDNMVPILVTAFKAGATLGEVMSAMREAVGFKVVW